VNREQRTIQLDGPGDLPQTYAVEATCGNCDWAGPVEIPKGTPVAKGHKIEVPAVVCPNCGCQELSRADSPPPAPAVILPTVPPQQPRAVEPEPELAPWSRSPPWVSLEPFRRWTVPTGLAQALGEAYQERQRTHWYMPATGFPQQVTPPAAQEQADGRSISASNLRAETLAELQSKGLISGQTAITSLGLACEP
jgi:hypothetical protein